MLATGLGGAGFASGCNFLLSVLGSVGSGFRIRVKVRISRIRVSVVV